MKKYLLPLVSTAAAATAVFLVTAPAEAFNFSFGLNGTISVDQTVTLEFTFLEGHGGWLGNYGIRDQNNNILATLFTETHAWTGNEDNDWLSTAANLTPTTPSVAKYTFVAGQYYKLGVWGRKSNFGQQPGAGPFNYQQDFLSAASNFNSYTFRSTGPNSSLGYQEKTINFDGLIIGFEDGWEKSAGRGNGDFNDLIVGVKEVPEPMTMAGLALGAGGLMAARRRRQNEA